MNGGVGTGIKNMDSTKIKSALHTAVSVGGNLLVLGIVPDAYKVYVLLAFNIAQVLYAFFDPTYAFQKIGKTK